MKVKEQKSNLKIATPLETLSKRDNSEDNKIQHKDHRGITLIALIITIIVMLILVGVTLSVALNGGLISKAQEAKTKTGYQEDREMLLASVIGAINNDAEVDYGKLDSNLPEGFTKADDGGYKGKSGNTFYVDKNGNITDEKPKLKVTVTGKSDGGTIKLTPENVADYLGRVVTNYTGKSQVAIDSTTYNVSTQYRLYYVDFDGKYGDGEGTVYLKADYTGNEKELQTTAPGPDDVVKIEELNPGLYNKEDDNGMPIPSSKGEQTPPSEKNYNMKAVKWLTNTKNWEGLKPTNYTLGISADDINYVVGAPSLEMMMDSYNTHYKLTGDENVSTDDLRNNKEARAKLYYQYNYEDYYYGYGVRSADSAQFSRYSTSGKSVKTDTIDTMYYPGDKNCCWLASPSASDIKCVITIIGLGMGYVYRNDYDGGRVLCPLVSLKSSVTINLE